MYTKNKQTLLMPKTNHNNKKRMEIATAKRQRWGENWFMFLVDDYVVILYLFV